MNKLYKKTKCYEKLDKEYQESLDLLIEFYGKLLNKGCPIGDILYTSHDFDKHCCNLYKIISDIFFANDMALSQKELYILDLAVLFHDISMATNIRWDRKKHSKESADYIKKEFQKTGTVLHNERGKMLTVNDLNAIQDIITAHSDVKDGTVSDDKNGVKNPNLSSNMPGGINGKLLAAILRLADELDVTSDRLGKQDFMEQLDENDEKQNESIKHWKNLNYFSAVKNDSEDSTKLLLVCDDNYITDHLDDASNIISNIKSIVKKITQELDELNKEVFNKRENAKLNFHIKDIEVETKVKEVANELNDPLFFFNNTNNIEVKSKNDTDDIFTENENAESPEIISHNLSVNLKEYIEAKKLLKCGHYLLNNTFCARDWIDTNDIIETSEICDKCIREFMNHCRANFEFYSDCIIIGLDLEGAILASLLAMNLGMSFQYVIPAKSENTNSDHDIIKTLPADKKIIIVTDAVCTYETIKSVVEKYELANRLVAIYTLLYRHPQLEEKDENLFSKTYCLNSDFPMEVSRKSKCKYYNSGTCMALNKGS